MQKSYRFILTILLLGSYLLSACAGAAPQNNDSGGDAGTNSNEVIDVDDNTNDTGSNANDSNDNDDNSQGNGNSNDSHGDDVEFHGVVEAVTTASITIDGVEYSFADFTEFKDIVSVGDNVKIHVVVGDDGSLIIVKIELFTDDDDDNGNGNFNSNTNSNTNSNDDDDNSNSGSNSNDNGDDDHKDDNGNKNDNDNDKDDD